MDAVANEVAPGVFELGNPFVNWWLVVDEEGLLVVDAGLPGHLPQLQDCLDQLGLTFGDIRGCVVTHGDIDHIGVAEALRREHGIRVFVHAGDDAAARGAPREVPNELLDRLSEPYLARAVEEFDQDGGFHPEFLTQASPLEDGRELDLPGRPLVVHCPGHTPGSCAFYLRDHDVVFTGDALVTVDIVTGERGPQLLPAFDNQDDEEAWRSLEILAGTEARVVAPGHGEVWERGIASAVGEARRRRAP